MPFALTELQGDLRDLVRDYVADRAPLTGSRDWSAPFDRAVWQGLCGELGLALLDVPEELGGLGLSAVELAVVVEAAATDLYNGPLLASTGLAAGLLAGAGSAAVPWLERLNEGHVFTAAVADDGGWWSIGSVRTSASEQAGAWRISGHKALVVLADSADAVVVAAQTPDQAVGLFVVDLPGGEGVTLSPPGGIDPSRPVCALTLTDAPASLLLADASSVIPRAGLRASVAVAADSVGAARRCLEFAAAYAGEREQFGRPIGAFQGVKHRLADVLVEVELATSAVYLAACHVAEGDQEAAAVSASMALVSAGDALAHASAAAVQVHGGIGFTWESPCHRFVRRGRANQAMLGARATHLTAVFSGAASIAS